MQLNQKEAARIEARLTEMAAELTELGCDSVSIFCTYRERGSTTGALAAFDGNYYARIGVLKEWLQKEQNVELAGALSQEGDEDEGL